MKDYSSYKNEFDALMGVKREPNDHEKFLFLRAQKYIKMISWIPGLRMIAVVNSLSMYATHQGSDIDLFIITAKNRIWFVRIILTLIFALSGVWRRGEDIEGNFCLSFWIDETALDLSKIAIPTDIYLFFWVFSMRPILADESIWSEFRAANPHFHFGPEPFQYQSVIIKNHQKNRFLEASIDVIESLIGYFGERRAQATWKKKGKPEGVIITRNILKFHDQDRRKEIRDRLIGGE